MYHEVWKLDVCYMIIFFKLCSIVFMFFRYDGNQVDLQHLSDVTYTGNGTDSSGDSADDDTGQEKGSVIDIGIDLSEFYLNVEWDIMRVPARRNIIKYSCCPEVYLDITFNITLRRKTLFYTINLIIPCVGISCLSILVFYLPSDSGEKVGNG